MSNLLGNLVTPYIRASGVGRGGGGGGNALSLPWEWNFETDQTNPSDARDDITLISGGNGQFKGVDTTATYDGFNPSSIGYDHALKHGLDGATSPGSFDLTLPGGIDASNGFRFMLIKGQNETAGESAWNHHGVELLSVDESHNRVDGIYTYYEDPNGWAKYYTAGSSTAIWTWKVFSGHSFPYAQIWYTYRIEFPADGSGTFIHRTSGLGTSGGTRTGTAAIDIDVSGWGLLNTLRIFEQPRYPNQYYRFAMFWIGSLTDAWPA